ncbi:lactococcin 972 family bacteriocin [Listeria fleischmannii]|uniref:lactococcin 972 family bacteriocin n=1 Tax=Listeria fleischmannii TaxID=1069827 RepID=UPI0016280774|nr:lactococcin 972 family bacteriocin [Listeria fleischmannii]MBC1419902.1 lactococcin 972 family bacteriocin [Listeria fleischmannii]
MLKNKSFIFILSLIMVGVIGITPISTVSAKTIEVSPKLVSTKSLAYSPLYGYGVTLNETLNSTPLDVVSMSNSTRASDSWQYGHNANYHYSNYYHPSRTHTSSVVKSSSNRSTSRAYAGQWSKASIWATTGVNYYYNYE